ncbi:MAG: phenylalanine 4-monooxygenase [Cytophagales bacterium]|nr:phenylalanine 4-monooxygenase [Cytophagales bacterium]
MRQVYENYTEEDQKVWQLLFDRQLKNLPKQATHTFMEGLGAVNFVRDAIPNVDKINEILYGLTGWKLSVVPGIVPDYTFFELMSNRHFPATTWLRKMEELDYLEEPDMFHDIFAHVPILSNQHFVDFLEGFSKIALPYCGQEWAIELLSRVYWFSVEFGLIRENENLRIYGAGILSSKAECAFSLSEVPPKYDFDVPTMMATPYKKDRFQDRYFVIDSYKQLYESLDQIQDVVKQRANEEIDMPIKEKP